MMSSIKMMFKDTIESLTDNHKDPLHVGEALACWKYYNFKSAIIVHVEVG